VRATQVLHCNLNVVDIAAAAALYERGLGCEVRMRSESTDADSTVMGLDASTHAHAWFLYDHRGGRVSPAIELAEWCRPRTAGATYADPSAIGLQALRFAVSSVTDATAALVDAGATVTGRTARDAAGVVVGCELLDVDGARIELVEDAVTAPTFTGIRLSCFDLAASVEWYGGLGWAPTGDVDTVRWDRGGEARVRSLTLADHPFELHVTEHPGAAGKAPAHRDANTRGLFRMALAVPDVRAAHAESEQGIGPEIGAPTYVPLPGTPLEGLWVSFFRDPNGVMVELVERAV
jgi:catechol 2,3-dioxygenase-like lactoylglutathione lyase family enzyme